MSLGDTLLQLLFRFIVNTVCGAYLLRSYVSSDVLLRSTFRRLCAVPLLLLLLLLLLLFTCNIALWYADTVRTVQVCTTQDVSALNRSHHQAF